MNNDKLTSLEPQFIGKTELQVQVREIGLRKSVLVSVLHVSSMSVSPATIDRRMRKAACDAARSYEVTNVDYTLINPGREIRRNAFDTNGVRYPIRIQRATYAFSAVA